MNVDIRLAQLGEWKVQVCTRPNAEEELRHPEVLEQFLNERWLPVVRKQYPRDYSPNFAMRQWDVPSFVVRFDMPCMSEPGNFPGFYEVEGNTAGLGLMVELGMDLHAEMAEAFRGLGIEEIEYGVARSRSDQAEDLGRSMLRFAEEGIRTMRLEGNTFERNGHSTPLWLRAGEEDLAAFNGVFNRCLLMHRDGGGHKEYLCELGGAKLLSDCEAPFVDFPEGFVVKPVRGWGSKSMYLWTPRKPWKEKSETTSKMCRIVERLHDSEAASDYLVQPFLPPTPDGAGNYRIWRIVAIWTVNGYKVVGGMWNERRTIKLHGADDTVWGPVRVTRG